MFGCGVIALQNIVSVVLHHWIPESSNCHTVSMAEKVNYNENESRISEYDDYDNNGSES